MNLRFLKLLVCVCANGLLHFINRICVAHLQRALIVAPVLLVLLFSDTSLAQRRLTKKNDFSGRGTVNEIQPGELTIAMSNGEERVCKIQDKDEDAISLDGGNIIFRMDAKIDVSGSLTAALLERGMYVAFEGEINRFGKTQGKVRHLKVISGNSGDLAVKSIDSPNADTFVPCEVIGRVISLRRNKLMVAVPKSRMARQERLSFEIDEDATFDISSNDLNLVRAGDTIDTVSGVEMSNGEFVIEKVAIKLTAERTKATISYTDQLYQKFSHLSDAPGAPRQERSDHFVLYTDLSEQSTKVLLAKLETMYGLISRYYGKKPRIAIDCYVVRVVPNQARRTIRDPAFVMVNEQYWNSRLPQIGKLKIEEGAGVTRSLSNGVQTKSIVYSSDNQSVVQHEAVHAYCAQAFGTAGPIWYAEGMAEMGQYWRPGELAVNVDPVVVDYLTNAKRAKRMKDIVAAGQITGDSWKAYAWRWALCHLLASNPNYSRRFKKLGVNMMLRNDDSFNKAFGKVSKEISFEYDQFTKNFDNGYRVDLCTWDWSQEPKELHYGNSRAKVEIKSQAGWQATPVQLIKGTSYDIICRGDWKISPDSNALTADGNSSGKGRLLGVVLNNFQLSEPFELGAKKRFTAPSTGQLFVRCRDKWVHLADNSGEITAYFRKTPKSDD